MVGWHHRLNGHEFEQTLGDGEGQGSLACCSLWDHKESDTTELTVQQQQNADLEIFEGICLPVTFKHLFKPPSGLLSPEELMLSNCGAGEDS